MDFNKIDIFFSSILVLFVLSVMFPSSDLKVTPLETIEKHTLENSGINLIELNEEEEEYANEIIGELNQLYLSKVKGITFNKDIEEEWDKLKSNKTDEREDCKCYGFSVPGRGLVFVNANHTKDIQRINLCHEILHIYIPTTNHTGYGNDTPHQIIRELSKQGVCYGTA